MTASENETGSQTEIWRESPRETPVREFLEAVENHEDDQSSSEGTDICDEDNPISLLDAFGIYPSRSPGPGAPRKERMAYSLLRLALAAGRHIDWTHDDSIGCIFLPVWGRYQDVCEVFWNARASGTTHASAQDSHGTGPPTGHLPVNTIHAPPMLPTPATTLRGAFEVSASPKTMLPPKVPSSRPRTFQTDTSNRRASKTSRGIRKRPHEQRGPLEPFRSSGWTQPRAPPLPASSSSSISTSLREDSSAALRRPGGPSHCPWDDYATSSSGFSSGRSRP
ncbi:hypothetical protein BD311DRAFT_777863 [Dichomitus squalens]|uniref:Uncharacterized protein n=1 Tax=Dichomitus squalens TaxID=114155 RepID=A0A4Q9MNN0_9APHY|nr:hypothetical protein BD311DRAFT_777863 [Dichomitus squalens]